MQEEKKIKKIVLIREIITLAKQNIDEKNNFGDIIHINSKNMVEDMWTHFLKLPMIELEIKLKCLKQDNLTL